MGQKSILGRAMNMGAWFGCHKSDLGGEMNMDAYIFIWLPQKLCFCSFLRKEHPQSAVARQAEYIRIHIQRYIATKTYDTLPNMECKKHNLYNLGDIFT